MRDLIFRRGNPSNKWERTSGLVIRADLLSASLMDIPIGSQVALLDALGRSSSDDYRPLEYHDLGLVIDVEGDGTFSGFQIVLQDDDTSIHPFSGEVHCPNTLPNLSGLTSVSLKASLGEPYWTDKDESEQILFYEYPDHEIQVEASLSGIVRRMIVTNDPVMASAEDRASYGVTKDWPPT